ncbi:DUF4157 domain-containing protein [Fluviicola taffensis]|uniref:eCIS core domain-containing protein n=1 Tax=Fluviicola taffensis TaxID=191579 RepID=UPI00313833BF
MSPHANKKPGNKSKQASLSQSQSKTDRKSASHFVDNQHQSVSQKKIQEIADNSPQAAQLRSVQEMADNSVQTTTIQKKENKTGLPDNLKGGIENLSGISLDDVKVHRNSDKPSQLQAHAYAQGTDIHLGPGQEKHLPHEAWHVVQQKQGRVQPTKQLKGTTNINDDSGLEKEADLMGAKANTLLPKQFTDDPETKERNSTGSEAPIQAMMSLGAFKALTNLGERRSSITAIDDAIQNYEDYLLNPILNDEEGHKQRKLNLLGVLRYVTNAYITDKEQNDPTNKRIAPVKSFKEDVLLEIEQTNGNIPSNQTIVDRIEQQPDADSTRLLILSIAKAPRAKTWIQDYLQVTSVPQKITTMTSLLLKGELPLILDQTFVNGAGSDLIGTFPKGKALSFFSRKVINLFVDLVTDLGALKKLASQRFDIDVANIKGLEVGKPTAGDDTVQAETDWTLEGLKRAYNLMIKLPDGHASSNASFAKLKRFTGGGGWYGDANTVSIGYDNINNTRADERTLSDKWNNRGTNVFTGKNSFDKSVRHEVGHAVDKQHGFSRAYCSTANGGNWDSYNSMDSMVKAYLLQNNSALSNHPACLAMVRIEIAKLITATASPNAVKTEVIRLMTQSSNLANIPFDRSIVDKDSIFEDLQKVNLKKPWNTSGGKDVAGKTFVYSNDTTLSAYDTAARARQVSNYQFRAPGEWFAEAYAAYYQPDQTQRGYGSVLQGRDATTYNYMETHVDISL